MLAFENLALSVRVTIVVLPVAFYFLILGLLNSRPHPQVLSARGDFALLVGALCPLFIVPLTQQLGHWAVALPVAGGLGACIMLMGPGGPSWVIYNLQPQQARRVIARAVQRLGLELQADGRTFRIENTPASVEIRTFPLLRNVSVRLIASTDELARRFERALGQTLSEQPAQTSPATAALLLVAAAMMVVPLTLVARHTVEIVRILTDLLK